MISREDFARAIDSFMGEMSAICVSQAADRIKVLPGLAKELRETRTLLNNPAIPLEQLVAIAFGAVDEFYGANRDDIIDQAYAFYLDQNRASQSG